MTIFVDNPRAIYIHIPKTGGNSIRSWMLSNVESAKGMFKGSFMEDHAPYSYIQKRIKEDHGLVFTVVRNPWARVVSAYHYHKGLDRKGNLIDFSTFVKTDMRSASRPQHMYVGKNTVILKLENIDEDFQQIQKYFNVWESLPVKNKSNHKHYTQYYNDETKEIVANKFKIDIIEYGYTYD